MNGDPLHIAARGESTGAGGCHMNGDPLHIAWARLFLRAAWHAGVRDVVLSPGSRSTPLAIAAHESPELRTTVVVDERAAAFFALGQARAGGRPSLLACTSGTAAAHYFPAVIEASMSGVPLIALTADRPWELQQAGASQTIDQTKLFGGFVRAFLALGAPEPHEAALRAVARVAAQAVAAALGPTPGPVHVNAPFRKPLEPSFGPAANSSPAPAAEPWRALVDTLLRAGPTRVLDARRAHSAADRDASAVAEVAALLRGAQRGLLVCGPAPAHGDVDAYRRAIVALGGALGFPILAEATSQVRFGAEDAARDAARSLPREERGGSAGAPVLVAALDALLRSPAFRARFAPDVLLEIGAPPTSTGYAQLLAENPRRRRVVIAPDGWTDPASTATLLVHADVTLFCQALRAHLAEHAPERAHLAEHAHSFAAAVAAADQDARAVIDASVATGPLATPSLATGPLATPSLATGLLATGSLATGSLATAALAAPTLGEAAVARLVAGACPAGSILVLGNSSPVRDVDAYVFPSATPLRVLHQRGASGIDGLISGAAGAQHASSAPVTLLLGDVSFLHDVGGLALARAAAGPLVIVAVNNGGGRIFEQLPIGRALGPGAAFERLFATPPALDLAAAAAAFGVAYLRAATPAELSAALTRAHAHVGATLVEAVVPPHDGAERHKTLWTRIDELFQPRKDATT